MKKLINAVDAVLTESLRGFGAAHADIVAVSLDPKLVTRRDAAARQGGADLGRRLGARAAARGLRRRRHARRRLPGRGLHLADARPDAGRGRGGRRRARRALDREELRRRRDELRDGGGDASRPLGHGADQRRRGGGELAAQPGAARRGGDGGGGEDRRRGGRARRRPGEPDGARRARERGVGQHGRGADQLHRAGGGHAHLPARRGRDRDGRRHPRRARAPPGGAAARGRDRGGAGRGDLRGAEAAGAATGCSSSSTAWAARR